MTVTSGPTGKTCHKLCRHDRETALPIQQRTQRKIDLLAATDPTWSNLLLNLSDLEMKLFETPDTFP